MKDYERQGVAIEKYVKQLILLSRLRNIQFTHKIMEDMVIEYEIENDYLYKKGETRGEEKGRRQGIITLAKAMKNNGEPIEKIMLYTSLNEEDIKKL